MLTTIWLYIAIILSVICGGFALAGRPAKKSPSLRALDPIEKKARELAQAELDEMEDLIWGREKEPEKVKSVLIKTTFRMDRDGVPHLYCDSSKHAMTYNYCVDLGLSLGSQCPRCRDGHLLVKTPVDEQVAGMLERIAEKKKLWQKNYPDPEGSPFLEDPRNGTMSTGPK